MSRAGRSPWAIRWAPPAPRCSGPASTKSSPAIWWGRPSRAASATPSFSPGADLAMLACLGDDKARLREKAGRLSAICRRLETCGEPVAAAINGLCLGGGCELALACHYRVMADAKGAVIGLPEAK